MTSTASAPSTDQITTAMPARFAIERWFAEFEFVEGMRNVGASDATAPTVAEVLALAGPEANDSFLALGLGYAENPGGERLRDAIAGLYDTIDADDVQVATGASEAILLVIWASLQRGDNVVVEDPCYQSHDSVAAALGAEVRHLRLRPEDGWKPDPERLASLVDGHTRLVFLNHPHNPTGSTLSAAEMMDLIRVVERAGATLVSDEVFRPIALDGPPMPSAADLAESAVSIGDMSKPWGFGGLRVGWCATHQRALLPTLGEVRDYTTMCCSPASEFLAEIALRHGDELLAPRFAVARRNRDLLARMIGRFGGRLTWVPPSGGYTAFIRMTDGSSEPLCRRLAVEEWVLLLPGSMYGDRHAGWVRIGFGGPEDGFRSSMDILERALAVIP
jgi:aspartate/methionine/tyrosine aminotransferase